ncbi:MAG: YbjN domain-containing protein [Ignavibacteriae bacterium]|nr:YbjN domain-containing protein [Ignavibacteriota bacterium]
MNNDNIKITIDKVNALLKKNFPGHLSFGDGTYTINRGSSNIMINVKEFVKNETIIECVAHVVTGSNITPDLMKFLLRKNVELHFGSFGLLFDDTITFSHSITGSNLDENELITTVSSVGFIADYYDDVIVEMAGGKRAADVGIES